MPSCPGMLRQSAQRPESERKQQKKLIVELKDKINIEDMLNRAAHGEEAGFQEQNPAEEGIQAEAVQALVALGYGSTESMKAVKRASPDCVTVEETAQRSSENIFFNIYILGFRPRYFMLNSKSKQDRGKLWEDELSQQRIWKKISKSKES